MNQMKYQKQWDFLKNKFEANSLAHAYIFSGNDLDSFIKDFAALVNRSEETKIHDPDLLIVKSGNSKSSLENKADSMEIDITQIRDAQIFLSYKAYYQSFKMVIIENAERMTIEAQHCFLKTLEEPKGKTLIILQSAKPEMLLQTIFSRCQMVKFLGGINASSTISTDLQRIIGSDLAEKFKYAKAANLEGDSFINMLAALQRYFRELLLVKIGVTQGQQSNYSVQKLQSIIRLIEDLSYQSVVSNASSKLALEILLMEL